MFEKIVVAYNGTSESERALSRAIEFAKSVNAELHAVIVKAAYRSIRPLPTPRFLRYSRC